MCHHQHESLNSVLLVLVDVGAELVEVAFLQKSVEGERGILCKVQMADKTCKVERGAVGVEQVLPAQVLDGETQVI
jgi:hypothetical protein